MNHLKEGMLTDTKSYIVLAIVALLFVLAVVKIVKDKSAHSCSGGCAGCAFKTDCKQRKNKDTDGGKS